MGQEMIKLSLRFGMPAFVLLVDLNCAAVAQDKLRIAGGLAGTWENSFSELGQNAGFFKKHGLVLEIFYTQGAGETQQAVISGSADIGTGIGTFNTFGAFAKGAPIRVIAATHTGANDLTWYVKADSPIKDKKDLAGKSLIGRWGSLARAKRRCPRGITRRFARSEASGMSKRILVIEDTENNRRILSDLLTNAGFEVLEAVDGEKGVAMAAESRPDLILMDIQLPIIDGYEATRRIKANPELRHIPIIAVTSYALSGDDAKALAAGCDGYFAKPFSPRVVLAKVHQFLA
jgi:two-component system, cell cycle response regulator DivK